MHLKPFAKKILWENTDHLFIQLFRYAFVGGLAFLVDYGLLYALTEYAHLYYLLSATLSFLAGLFVNYLVSKWWVFSLSKFDRKGIEFALFALVGVVGLLLNNLLMWLLTAGVGIYYMYSKLVAALVVYMWNFLARKYWVFKRV